MSTAFQAISRGTASPVVVTDERWRIVTLNAEAERLFNRASQDAEGQPCHALLCGRDRFGNHFCHEQCAVGTMARRGEPVQPFELDVTSGSGEVVRVACSVIALHDGPESRIVHIMTPIPATPRPAGKLDVPARDARDAACGAESAARYGLTGRELEVLRLLADGKDCNSIAGVLFISLPTVRNHIHNFLRKMGAHSQVEAVVLAYREKLI